MWQGICRMHHLLAVSFCGWVFSFFCFIVAVLWLEAIVWLDIFWLFGKTNSSGKKCFRQILPAASCRFGVASCCSSEKPAHTTLGARKILCWSQINAEDMTKARNKFEFAHRVFCSVSSLWIKTTLIVQWIPLECKTTPHDPPCPCLPKADILKQRGSQMLKTHKGIK